MTSGHGKLRKRSSARLPTDDHERRKIAPLAAWELVPGLGGGALLSQTCVATYTAYLGAMTKEEMALWVQVAAVVAAVVAAIIALVVSALDRRNARRIADEDRRAALRQAHMMFELQALLRLAQNTSRGGHSDSDISKDMGAEWAALVGALGPDRVPISWASLVDLPPEEIEAKPTDGETPKWLKKSIEAHTALAAVAEEIRRENEVSDAARRP